MNSEVLISNFNQYAIHQQHLALCALNEQLKIESDDKLLQLERDAQNKVEEVESSLVNMNARLNDASRGLVEIGERL